MTDIKTESMVDEMIQVQAEIMNVGKELGYEDEKLFTYVGERMTVVDKRMQDKYERELRALEMETRRVEREGEMKQRAHDQELELKLMEARRMERAQEIELKKLSVQEQENQIRLTGEILDYDTGFTYKQGNKVPLPNLPTFQEDIDRIDAFLDRFETYATCKGWDKSVWSIAVASYLTGNALEVYYKMSKADRQNYSALSKELLKYYQITDFDYKNKFWSSRCHKDESPTQFISRMSEYFDQWMELSGVKSKDEMRDVILRHQFNRACTSELNIFIGERDVSSIDEVRKLTEQFAKVHNDIMLPCLDDKSQKQVKANNNDYDKANDKVRDDDHKYVHKSKSSSRKVRLCYTCKQSNHIAKDCPTIKCYKCGKSGHKSFNCNQDLPIVSAGTQQKCSGCQSHYCPKCNSQLKGSIKPQKASSDAGSDSGRLSISDLDNQLHSAGGCVHYDKGRVNTPFISLEDRVKHLEDNIVTHISASVFSPKSHGGKLHVKDALVENTKVECLRDSGCSGVVVAKYLVKPSQLTKDIVLMKMTDSSIIRCQIAKIYVHTPWYSGMVNAMCIDKPICDLVLGNVPGAKDPEDADLDFQLYKPVCKRKVPEACQRSSSQPSSSAVTEPKEWTDPAVEELDKATKSCECITQKCGEMITRMQDVMHDFVKARTTFPCKANDSKTNDTDSDCDEDVAKVVNDSKTTMFMNDKCNMLPKSDSIPVKTKTDSDITESPWFKEAYGSKDVSARPVEQPRDSGKVKISHKEVRFKDGNFSKGDKVMVLVPTDQTRLKLDWKGPFEIVKRVSTDEYLVLFRGKPRIFQTSMLKEYICPCRLKSANTCNVSQCITGVELMSTSLML